MSYTTAYDEAQHDDPPLCETAARPGLPSAGSQRIHSACQYSRITRESSRRLPLLTANARALLSTACAAFSYCTPEGERSWYVRYQVGHGAGRQERFYRLGSFDGNTDDFLTLGQAIDRANHVRVDAKKHKRDRFAEERQTDRGLTFDDLCRQWIDKHGKKNKKSWRHDEGLYKRHIKARLGKRVVAELRRRDVVEVLDEIVEEVTPIQANRSHSLISAVLNWALAEDKIDVNPAHGIRKRASETARARVMKDDELKVFWRALTDTPIDNAIRLLLLLGQRRSEVCYAGAAELADNAWNIPGPRTKNKLPHMVPLTPYARSLFGDGLDIYPTTLSHRVRDVVRDLSIKDFHLHDLRHQAATGMAALNVRQDIRDRVLNQVTGRRQTVGSRYDQYEYLAEKRDALQRWEEELLRIVGSTNR